LLFSSFLRLATTFNFKNEKKRKLVSIQSYPISEKKHYFLKGSHASAFCRAKSKVQMKIANEALVK